MLRSLPFASTRLVMGTEIPRVDERDAPVVLVVDDDLDIRETLSDVLVMEGYQVMAVQHGAEALELLRRHHVDLIVLDIMMPVMDGHAFIAAKNRDPTISPIPIIAITAAAQPQVEGAMMFMRKPFQLEHLLAAVEHCLQES